VLEQLFSFFSGSSFALWGPFLLLIFCGLGLPLPEDIVLVTSGILVATKSISWSWEATAVLMLFAVLLGDSCTFFAGKFFGEKVRNSKIGKKMFTASRLKKAQSAFDRYGSGVVFVARFLPGLRAPIYFTSANLNYSYFKFLLMDFLAAIISVPLWVYLGYWGWLKLSSMEEISKIISQYQSYFWILLIVFVVVMYSLLKKVFKEESD